MSLSWFPKDYDWNIGGPIVLALAAVTLVWGIAWTYFRKK
jgi:hypothetical protein